MAAEGEGGGLMDLLSSSYATLSKAVGVASAAVAGAADALSPPLGGARAAPFTADEVRARAPRCAPASLRRLISVAVGRAVL